MDNPELVYWQREADRLRQQRNELREAAATAISALDIVIHDLALLVHSMPPPQRAQTLAAVRLLEKAREALSCPKRKE